MFSIKETHLISFLFFFIISLIRIGCDLAWFTMAVYVGIQFALALKHDVNLKLETFESGIYIYIIIIR